MNKEKQIITIIDYVKELNNDLIKVYNEKEAKKLAEEYCKEKLGYNNTQFFLEKSNFLKKEQLKKLEKDKKNLIKAKPLQYILKKSYFYGLEFYVNKNVLIPRQETELLVDAIIKRNKGKENLMILDICSGSGCIGISLKKYFKDAKVFAIEISDKAIKIHKKNCKKNNVEIKIKKYNILSKDKFPFKEKFDIIISNPPYVLESEKKYMHKNVLEYEPSLALYVKDNNPLIFYEKISNIAKNISVNKCELYYEINENFANEIIKINEKNDINSNIVLKDLNDKNRIIIGEMKKILK